MSPANKNKQTEYDRQINNLQEYENNYNRRRTISKFNSQVVMDSDGVLTNEMVGLLNKINKCRKSLSLPPIDYNTNLPNRQLPSSMVNTLLNKNLPIKLRKSLEHSPIKRHINNKFWTHEKKLIYTHKKVKKYTQESKN